MPSDTERLDFLQRGKWTRWVGCNTRNGHEVMPVFAGGDLRKWIDHFMWKEKHYALLESQPPTPDKPQEGERE